MFLFPFFFLVNSISLHITLHYLSRLGTAGPRSENLHAANPEYMQLQPHLGSVEYSEMEILFLQYNIGKLKDITNLMLITLVLSYKHES